ncbi:MAG: L-2-hydroxyglutarate oxidase [Phycisphaerae bacterium]|jgi:L-2-hydroxyglutarate oxidase
MSGTRRTSDIGGTAPAGGPPPRYDLAVIGAGIVGLATAKALVERYRLSLVVIEAEPRLGVHQTGNNSGVIHSGLYYKPGSLKARLCTAGREEMYRFAAENGITHERCGKVVVALDESELPALAELERRGTANGLRGLRRLSIGEVREHEPHVAGVAGLFVEETGIIDYKQVLRAYAEHVTRRGGEVRLSWRLRAVSPRGDALVLHTTGGDLECKALVNCGGLQSDRIARMCGLSPEVKIIPFRGEYYRLAEEAWGLCRNLIYPVPNPAFPFLGVHFTRMAGGGIEAGPNAVLAFSRHGYSWGCISPRDLAETLAFPGLWKLARKYWRTGAGEICRSLSKRAFLAALQRLMPELRREHLRPGGAGVRAQAVARDGSMVDDFRIQQGPRMVHVLNAPSPAATASLSIGRYIAETAEKTLDLKPRPQPAMVG